jgi:hypothetical protein
MQPDLFNAAPQPHKLARRGAPATSKLAALAVPNFATHHHAAIVQVLQDHGARGLTVHEIAAFCRLDAHAIGKRTNELERGQVIEVLKNPDGSDATRQTPAGRAARVWVMKGGAR